MTSGIGFQPVLGLGSDRSKYSDIGKEGKKLSALEAAEADLNLQNEMLRNEKYSSIPNEIINMQNPMGGGSFLSQANDTFGEGAMERQAELASVGAQLQGRLVELEQKKARLTQDLANTAGEENKAALQAQIDAVKAQISQVNTTIGSNVNAQNAFSASMKNSPLNKIYNFFGGGSEEEVAEAVQVETQAASPLTPTNNAQVEVTGAGGLSNPINQAIGGLDGKTEISRQEWLGVPTAAPLSPVAVASSPVLPAPPAQGTYGINIPQPNVPQVTGQIESVLQPRIPLSPGPTAGASLYKDQAKTVDDLSASRYARGLEKKFAKDVGTFPVYEDQSVSVDVGTSGDQRVQVSAESLEAEVGIGEHLHRLNRGEWPKEWQLTASDIELLKMNPRYEKMFAEKDWVGLANQYAQEIYFRRTGQNPVAGTLSTRTGAL